MKTVFALFACLALVAAPALVEAGGENGNGGGSKQNGQIIVRNRGDSTLIVRIDQGNTGSAEFPQDDTDITDDTIAAFESTGGRRVEPGRSTTFRNLRNGNHTVSASFVEVDGPLGPVTGAPSTQTVRVRNNAVTVSFGGDFDGAQSTVTPASASVGSSSF